MDTQQVSGGSALDEATLSAFRAQMGGNVVVQGDPEYDQARQVWNAAIEKRPLLIARPPDTNGVVKAVNFAREHNLPLAVRSGGHGTVGFGVSEGGLVIDMSLLKGIEVDRESRTARVQAGVLGMELGRATLPHGLALPLGQVPTTGVAGVLLGGGVGWLTRMYGLTIDSLLSAEVVTADGQVLTASETENADLFWALRGGGGNFGVVTRMDVRLHPVNMVLGGLILHPIEHAADVLRFYRDFAEAAPDAFSSTLMFMTVPPIPMVPAELHGRRALAVAVCYVGDLGEGQALVGPLRAFGEPLADMVAPMPFSVVQGMGEAGGMRGLQHDVRSDHLLELSDGAIDTLAGHTLNMPGPLTQTHILQLGGALSRVAPDATAFPHRNARYLMAILPSWGDPMEAGSQRTWMNDFAREMKPHTGGGVYVNFLGDEGPGRVREAYGANYDRLASLKQKYDPTNFFRLNQNITPNP